MRDLMLRRREFIEQCARFGVTVGALGSSALAQACVRNSAVSSTGGVVTNSLPSSAAGSVAGWSVVPGILARIRVPNIPARSFVITAYGAIGDGRTDATNAIGRTIAACRQAGGGRIVVPQGKFLTGPVHLQSKMELHVSEGATLLFSDDASRYLPTVLTRFEGVECYNYSPLIYAVDAEDVAVTGTGTLDGQADETHWWPWKGGVYGKAGEPNQLKARTRLLQMAEDGAPVIQRQMGEASFLRPSFVQMYRCKRVLVQGVTIVRSPMWEVHPVLSRSVTVRDVKISTHGPNNDGCNPESCQDVLIEGCTFDTGDDCIAIKSGRNADGRRVNVPTEYVVVRNCVMKDGHGGVTVGSEISGNVRHVYVEKCQMDSPQLERALRLKTNAMRGGILEHIFMRDVTVGQVSDSILSIDFTYEEGANGPFAPMVRDIELERVTSTRSVYGAYLKGFANAPIRDVRMLSCTFNGVARPDVLEHVTGFTRTNTRVNGVLVPQ